MEQFDSEFIEYANKVDQRMWFGVGAATLAVFLFLLWGVCQKPVKPLKLKSFPSEKASSCT